MPINFRAQKVWQTPSGDTQKATDLASEYPELRHHHRAISSHAGLALTQHCNSAHAA